MNKKIIGMFVCMLLIATAVPAVESQNNRTITKMAPNTSQSCTRVHWIEKQKLLASDGAANDYFGWSVSVNGDTALIGAYYDDDHGANSGSAYVFTHTGTAWTQQAKLLASDGAAGDEFGVSVSLSGDTALIGAPADDDNGADSGSVYVFTRTGTTWTQQTKLHASDGAAGDWFGWSVSLDGNTALVSAPDDDDNGDIAGSAYVFTRTGTTWSQQAKLLASDGAGGDEFGYSVSLSGDTALIGAHWDDSLRGSAYVFTRTGTTWTQQAKLLASDGAGGDELGVSVSLSGDTALIGACSDDDNGDNSGSAYAFTRTGTTWTQQAKLLASDGAAGDEFGYSVSLSGDTALIGAIGDDSTRGSAYVFTRTGTTWTQQAKLLASDGAATDWFGESVSLSEDTALIGAPSDDDNGANSGSAYVFTKNQSPNPPTIEGPTSGKVGQPYTYTFKSTDPDNDNVYYFINWGDQTNSSWLGPYPSGQEILVNHTWAQTGVYAITAKAKDIHDDESNWSEPFTVSILGPNLEINITGGIGVNAVIMNNGTANASGVEWQIHVKGGILGLINKTVNGTIDIPMGESRTVSTGLFLGLGPITITARAADKEKTATGIILLFYVIGVR